MHVIASQGKGGDKVWFGRVCLAFAWWRASTGKVLASEVPEGEEESVRQRIVTHPHYREAAAGELLALWEGADPGRTAKVRDEPATQGPTTNDLRTIALQHGWSMPDLVGAGLGGLAGIDGGRSPRSGLTLAEMTLSVPPRYWTEQGAELYPWELPDWRAPGPGWIPPSVPPKSHPKALPAATAPAPAVVATTTYTELPSGERVEGESRVEVVTDAREPNTLVPQSDPLSETDTPAPQAEGEEDLEPEGEVEEEEMNELDELDALPPASTDDPAVEAGYPADKVPHARQAAHELVHKRGDCPTGALNYSLRQLKLPKVNDAQRDALLAAPPPHPIP